MAELSPNRVDCSDNAMDPHHAANQATICIIVRISQHVLRTASQPSGFCPCSRSCYCDEVHKTEDGRLLNDAVVVRSRGRNAVSQHYWKDRSGAQNCGRACSLELDKQHKPPRLAGKGTTLRFRAVLQSRTQRLVAFIVSVKNHCLRQTKSRQVGKADMLPCIVDRLQMDANSDAYVVRRQWKTNPASGPEALHVVE
ncbi:hypothetical protein J1614_009316 [Plenodomus biglobosus]|nr:hypothetical protein J1614_009316 [Plenodomus biglobosus]